jgi:hypothetical protein
MQTITSQITRHLNNHIILCGNFNRDIALVGHMQGSNIILPQQQDHQWKLFTQNLGLTYIPTNTSYTRQGGLNYTHTSLLDGYYIKSPTHITYTSQTNTDFPHNSDHFPVSLFLPNNIILARPPPTLPLLNSRLLNLIPQKTLDLFNLTFFTTHSTQIDTLTNLLQNNESLTQEQWQVACHQFEDITTKITETINNTCMALLLPQLTHHTNRLGGFLPRSLQQKWKNLIATHHLIRKAINIVKTNPNWRNHPIIQNISNRGIPPPPPPTTTYTPWIQDIATIGKNAQKEARTIIAKHSRKSAQKAIAKFQNLINTKPKNGIKAIFQNTDNPPLDSLMDLNNNIIT